MIQITLVMVQQHKHFKGKGNVEVQCILNEVKMKVLIFLNNMVRVLLKSDKK